MFEIATCQQNKRLSFNNVCLYEKQGAFVANSTHVNK